MNEVERTDVSLPSTSFGVVELRAPSGMSQRLLDWQDGTCVVSWTSGSGSSTAADEADSGSIYVGLGVAEVLRATGEGRFVTLQNLLEMFRIKHPELHVFSKSLRFFGGASFAVGPDGAGEWSEFGDAQFVLPRVLYVDGPDRARLLAVSPPGQDRETRDLLRAVERLFVAAPLPAGPALDRLDEQASIGEADWERLLDRIQQAIDRGELEKVVAARRLTLRLSGQPRLSEVLGRLERSEPRSARFALRLGKRTFLGATPERLVRKLGRSVRTEALAGSISAELPDGATRLLKSAKDLAEHRVVVDALSRVLEPLCSKLSIPAEPEIRALRRILHLRTPLSGTLHTPGHVLDLVARLHPTPAVGGYPRESALGFIAKHEPVPRGWYAAPFGWVDLQGDGEFVVALRSALLEGQQAHIFAGAGIVQGSVARDEYAETELKMNSMLSALGLSS